MLIENLQDIVNNYEKLKNMEFCYIDGAWSIIENEKEIQKITDKRFPITMVDCGLLVLDNIVMSHHSYRIYKLSTILSDKNIIKDIKNGLYGLILTFQNKRSFSSIKEIESYLDNYGYKTCRIEIPNFSCFWSSYKYDKAFIIKDLTSHLDFAFRYYSIAENLTKKNNLFRHFLRTARNLFYLDLLFPYAPRLSESKYYTPVGNGAYSLNKNLWEKDYKEFEKTIIEILNKDIESENNGNRANKRRCD